MKSTLLAFGLLASSASAKTILVTPRLISYNIRWAVPVPGIGEPHWNDRRGKLGAQLNYETAGRPESLVCMQEVVESQLHDVTRSLGDTWTSIGVGRDDGIARGEFSPILYRPDTWNLVGNTTYWLSETPEVIGSVGWDAALPRIVTVGHFEHVKTGLPLVYMCTHFDHVGQVARREAASLLVRLAEAYAESASADSDEPTPVFLGGDLNITPDNPAFHEMIADGHFSDVRDVVDESRIHGHFKTFTGFSERAFEQNTRIDHVFVWRADVRDMNILTYGVLENRFDDGLWLSDHRPVVVDVEFAVNRTCISRS
ncbi:endonuclease/exonuclease/phosphatase family protein [Plectosphaerella plurivora]|uniref:Endonuclease/exonuclease/phosphatase family protein n=1 Tax=Plectosphaerella plurivora TaxID=936078 RepID=A0A9P8VFU1_9PEZI|nr:endonuclease/exonuclease/phosphatase family protein [Plectosphaerella plurivora]